jgi:hypothetical protein
MKNAIGNVEYVFVMFQFLQNIARLKSEGADFQHLFLHAVSYVDHMQKCKASKLAMC